MINEVTKTVADALAKKQAAQRGDGVDDQQDFGNADRCVQQPSSSGVPVLALAHHQQIFSEESLYKCSSADSLASLQQQFVSSSPSLSSSKRYIVEDNSDYGSCTSPAQSRANGSVSGVPRSISATVTNFLKPRMEFTGYQISGYKKYQVVVTLKTVELPKDGISSLSPHLTGFLTIRGLTNQHPEISTYFESFAVTHKDLGFLSSTWSKDRAMTSYMADDQTDLEHWLNFPSFKQLFLGPGCDSENRTPTINDLLNGQESFGDYLENRYIFMRWKEKFLVPDALIDGVEGASYDGFYYIVHDQVTGAIQGFYYHEDAEKFQQLELVASFKSLNDCSNCSFEFA
ncbi:hypothetical protein HG535_0A02310 [Zygotorulaspora mrakii]|uniref:Vacuolar import and degradation protein 24 n=1 Tax=Zygotorulaspora mrakii TaxID=42260 RepID=A0A7H9AVT7_ZYGMR|nr:uncharacterized protein HG535_0A02310 [Zygotorulaspora mrakii]QLG70293.1 hypothetical protein HG535_0A02310 [Zygotorulaspora mrakii]